MLERLTQRERQVAQLVANALSNKEIARSLGITEGTVKVHLVSIFVKLEARNRTQVAVLAGRAP